MVSLGVAIWAQHEKAIVLDLVPWHLLSLQHQEVLAHQEAQEAQDAHVHLLDQSHQSVPK